MLNIKKEQTRFNLNSERGQGFFCISDRVPSAQQKYKIQEIVILGLALTKSGH